ncbi:hypothetical protein HZA96_02275 [Candidatus Woesearchaeota archaeon]|nr:hypothetical protein [Candidatus Woesearchaeota archaeon]
MCNSSIDLNGKDGFLYADSNQFLHRATALLLRNQFNQRMKYKSYAYGDILVPEKVDNCGLPRRLYINQQRLIG